VAKDSKQKLVEKGTGRQFGPGRRDRRSVTGIGPAATLHQQVLSGTYRGGLCNLPRILQVIGQGDSGEG